MEKSRRASKDGEPTAPDADGRFRAIFDGVNDGIFISDPATGRFMEINEPGCRMFGYSRAELLGRDVDALSSGVYPHTREAAIELNERARQGKAQIFEWQCRRKNGELFWTEISLRYAKFGETPGIVAIFRDIAERKRLNAQIIHMGAARRADRTCEPVAVYDGTRVRDQ